jgi:N utilization substance protein B
MSDAAHGRRGTARVAAVQALYQIEFTHALPSAVIEEFSRHRFGDPGGDESQVPDKIDAALFADIVNGAASRLGDLDAMVSPLLAQGWRIERIDPVLRACLRAGAFELVGRADVPAKVAINEYVGVARRFFGGGEPGVVNAVLDQLARKLRPTEFGHVGTGADG